MRVGSALVIRGPEVKVKTSSCWGATLTVSVVFTGSSRGFGASTFRSRSNCESLNDQG